MAQIDTVALGQVSAGTMAAESAAGYCKGAETEDVADLVEHIGRSSVAEWVCFCIAPEAVLAADSGLLPSSL